MTSIRRRTATLVALSMTVLLVIGGVVLVVVLRRAMTAQFDEALVARAAALQSLTRFDGTKVEIDFAGEAMPRYARRTNAEFFVLWVRDAGGWRVVERSESLSDGDWPSPVLRDAAEGTRDTTLPDGGLGRAVLIGFVAPRERDEEGDHRGEAPTGTGGASPTASASSAPVVRLLVALPRDPLDRALSVIGWCIAGVGGALALACIAAARWAVSRGLVPLGDLSRRVQSLGPDTLGTRLDPTDLPAELRPIAEQLSGLLARLEEAFEREKRFSAAASHELRTPIAELRMLLEVAASQPRTSAEWSRTAGTALDVLFRAQSLCETLLRLSRAAADHALPDAQARAEVGLVLAAQAARFLSMHGGDARLLRVERDDESAARVDETTLTSIVGNLIDNALRHGSASPDDPVVVRARSEAGFVRIEIRNPAPALTANDLSHLFEPFWRKDASRHDQSGFGLGLAVARTLARASGGDVTARRDEPSTLVIQLTLPAAP
ncbi:MAG: GHKL domain-containing protein [Phycisphaerales bacterium]|nr:GHKL domain-containing protein [Phycisphaerales bacterium]